MLPELTKEEILRYSRHLLVPEIGVEGQRKLKAGSALIVGTGGLGSPVALYLAAAGVGHIGLIDFDAVDASNLQRQVIHGMGRVGQPKVVSARARMLDLNPHIRVSIWDEPFTRQNALDVAAKFDVLIDGTDNFPTRYLLNDVGVMLGKPVVYGSVYRFDGQVSVFDAREGPCYRCIFPDPPPAAQTPSCADSGVLGTVPGTIGTLQGTEAIKLLTGVGQPLIGRLLLYNAYESSFEYVRLKKNPKCRICGENPEITTLIDYDAFCGVQPVAERAGDERDISPQELADRLRRGAAMRLIDVREAHELQIARLPQAENIPLGELAASMDDLPHDEEIILICKRGNRSLRALEMLTSAGFCRVRHLAGGLNAWAREIDDSLPVY